MKRTLIILALIASASCGWHGTGTVVEKDYHPAWVQIQTQCHTVGKSTVCVPNNIYHSESWSLKVRDQADAKTHWVDVSEQDYNSSAVGSSFSNGEGS